MGRVDILVRWPGGLGGGVYKKGTAMEVRALGVYYLKSVFLEVVQFVKKEKERFFDKKKKLLLQMAEMWWRKRPCDIFLICPRASLDAQFQSRGCRLL